MTREERLVEIKRLFKSISDRLQNLQNLQNLQHLHKED